MQHKLALDIQRPRLVRQGTLSLYQEVEQTEQMLIELSTGSELGGEGENIAPRLESNQELSECDAHGRAR
jgi:hypothetical protein